MWNHIVKEYKSTKRNLTYFNVFFNVNSWKQPIKYSVVVFLVYDI